MSEEDKKPIKLVRMPDGSMRPATDTDSDIGNIWATQKNIRSVEAHQEKIAKEQGKPRRSKRLFKKKQKATVITTPTVVKPSKPAAHPDGIYRGQQAIKAQTKAAPAPGGTKEIAISLTLPKISAEKPKKHAKKAAKALKAAPKWAYAVAALVALPAFLITWGVISRDAPKKGDVQGETIANVPDYATLAPNGDITDTTSQKINYDPAKKVASFTDKINGYEVTVSMQPIPDTFKPAIADNVKKVAEQFAANTVLPVDNGAAYLGTSAKGPQSFVGYRGDLLVFMTSKEKIENSAWAEYFNTLK